LPEQIAQTSSDAIKEPFESALNRLMSRLFPGVGQVGNLARLSGGASQETWSQRVPQVRLAAPAQGRVIRGRRSG
jgi:hypothetical protein